MGFVPPCRREKVVLSEVLAGSGTGCFEKRDEEEEGDWKDPYISPV